MRRAQEGESPFTIEPFEEDDDSFGWLELAAVGTAGIAVVDSMPPSEGAARVGRGHGGVHVPALLVVVGDLRDGEATVNQMTRLRRSGVPSVAVAAASRGDLERLAKPFDTVLPVTVPPGARAVGLLGPALLAVTAFARAKHIGLAVDDVYPFYVRAGCRLRIGYAEASTPEGALIEALRRCRIGKPHPRSKTRLLLHVEGRHIVLEDVRRAAQTALRLVRPDDIAVSVSGDAEGAFRVSLVASVPIVPGERWT